MEKKETQSSREKGEKERPKRNLGQIQNNKTRL